MSERATILDICGARGGCMRTYLLRQVNGSRNEGAEREADEATSALQEPDTLRDTTESPYVTDEVEFRPLRTECGHCDDSVRVDSDGGIDALGCSVSGYCELILGERLCANGYEPSSAEDLGTQAVPCGGYGCSASVALCQEQGVLTPTMLAGACAVDRIGIGWRDRAVHYFKNEPLEAPDPEAVEAFDGVDINNPDFRQDIGYQESGQQDGTS